MAGHLWSRSCQHLERKNPQLEVVTELIRGQHPHLKGFYSKTPSSLHLRQTPSKVYMRIYFPKCTGNKNQRVICVKNMDPEVVLLHATRLRNALGRKVVKLKTRHVTKHPSVQGTWTTDVQF
ncbi:hypothetical protein SLA2020_271200 [Shorea laevis]